MLADRRNGEIRYEAELALRLQEAGGGPDQISAIALL